METYFENQCKYTKEFCREVYLNYMLKSPIMIVLMVISSFLVLFEGLVLIFSKNTDNLLTAIPNILFIVLVWAILIFFIFVITRIRYKQGLEQNSGSEPERKLAVTNEGIDVIHLPAGSTNHISFLYIKKVMISKNYILLITRSKVLIGFKKDSFTKGTAEEFQSFLVAKGLKR